jgi:hypothetical protein
LKFDDAAGVRIENHQFLAGISQIADRENFVGLRRLCEIYFVKTSVPTLNCSQLRVAAPAPLRGSRFSQSFNVRLPDNPRMSRRLISSGSSFEAEIGYSRAVVDDDWVFVSGTTGFERCITSKPS